jgi:D-3-phosphoglycerate dehydrogenase
MANILFLDTVHPDLEKKLNLEGHTCILDNSSLENEILQKIEKFDGIVIRSRFKITASFLEKSTHLKFIARAGSGMENIDVAYAEKLGIRCINSPEANAQAVAEHALGMLLSLTKKITLSNAEVKLGQWNREKNRGFELYGKTFGVIGYGNNGSLFAQLIAPLAKEVLVYDKYKKVPNVGNIVAASFEKIVQQSDIISLHIPLNEETEYWFDNDFFEKLKKPIWLINCARGKLLRITALLKAIDEGKVLGACLDVLEFENTAFEGLQKQSDQSVFKALLNNEKVLITPHIAGWSHESNIKIADVLFKKIQQILVNQTH